MGAYHTTPILAFRFRHAACAGTIEIRTDPANTAYVVHSGARKRDVGEARDGQREGEVVVAGLKTEGEKVRLANDPFARVEERVADEVVTRSEKGRVEELYAASGVWDDPGEMNRRLRREFRVGRKGREREREKDEEVRERIGFGGELVAESEEDVARAGLVEFGEEVGGVVDVESRVRAKALFDRPKDQRKMDGRANGRTKANNRTISVSDRPKDNLRKSLGTNTLAAIDPFLTSSKSSSTPTATPSIKRKRGKSPDSAAPLDGEANLHMPRTTSTLPLVDYDSD